jgi:hypothetical protein
MGRSADEIAHEVERNRAHIRESAGELRHRLSPETLVSNSIEYMRGPGGDRLLNAARDNPLAVVLMMAGAGWLFYTASRQRSLAPSGFAAERRHESGHGAYADEGISGTYLDRSRDDPGVLSATREASFGSHQSHSQRTSGAARAGVLGDQTQAQKLNQKGNPEAQIREQEVRTAFAGGSGTNGSDPLQQPTRDR